MSKSVAATFLASIYILSSVFILPTDTQAASSNGQKVYSFGVDDWCPQHCQDNSNSEGYIIDIVRAIFATEKARIEILYVPSQRAVKGTQEGALTAC